MNQKTVSLLIPRETPRREQILRAHCFKERELLDYIPWKALSTTLLRKKIESLLKEPQAYQDAMSKFNMTGFDVICQRIQEFRKWSLGIHLDQAVEKSYPWDYIRKNTFFTIDYVIDRFSDIWDIEIISPKKRAENTEKELLYFIRKNSSKLEEVNSERKPGNRWKRQDQNKSRQLCIAFQKVKQPVDWE